MEMLHSQSLLFSKGNTSDNSKKKTVEMKNIWKTLKTSVSQKN